MDIAPLPPDPKTLFIESETKIPMIQLSKMYSERGHTGCSRSRLQARRGKERWDALRKQYWSKRAAVTRANNAQVSAYTLQQLNAETNAVLVQPLIRIGEKLLKERFLVEKDGLYSLKDGASISEFRQIVSTIKDIVYLQRLVHNFTPNQPVPGQSERDPITIVQQLILDIAKDEEDDDYDYIAPTVPLDNSTGPEFNPGGQGPNQ
jgi:hypothetical protein